MWPIRQNSQRSVGTHGSRGLCPLVRHRGNEHLELLGGVAEELLTTGDGRVGVNDVGALGQVVEVEATLIEPLSIGLGRSQSGLDLGIVNDAMLREIGEEHTSGLEASLLDDVGRRQVEHTGLGREDDQSVIGHPVPGGTQTVAVKHCADLIAIGEGDAGRTVPGLHEEGVELVEVAQLLSHLGVLLPRLGNHHEDGVRQGASSQVEQLEHLIEGGRVRSGRGANGVQPSQVTWDEVGLQQGLTSLHPVAVAAHRVDLAVVGDESVRVGQLPGREGVRRKPGVDQGQCAGQVGVVELGEDLLELVSRQHPLVDQGPRGQRGEVDPGLVLGTSPQHEGQPLQIHANTTVTGTNEEMLEMGHGAQGHLGKGVGVDRDLTPSQHLDALVRSDELDGSAGAGTFGLVNGHERQANGVGPRFREADSGYPSQEGVRNLEENACAVASGRISASGTTVVKIAQCLKSLLDDLVAGHTCHGGHEGHAAGIVLELGVVEALSGAMAEDHRYSFRRRQVCCDCAATPDPGTDCHTMTTP